MVKFAHISDVHLGGWKQQEMRDLNSKSFQLTIDKCIENKLDFVLIAGDLFDTAYPGIEILKETFAQFKRLKESKIPCFIIAGSHDYSVSGKTFLDVLEKAGFCKNVTSFDPETATAEQREEKIILNPVIHGRVAIYGYPGKKSGLEISDLRKVKLNDAPGLFKIFMLHTTLDKAKGTLPIDAIESNLLPPADYYALGHLHIDFQYENFIYPGPVFPNNFAELEDLENGSFYIVDTESINQRQKIELKIKQTLPLTIQITNAITANEIILAELEKYSLQDKIILLRMKGEISTGKPSDIKFQQIEQYAKDKGAYFILRNTHDLKEKQEELNIDIEAKTEEAIEEETIKVYSDENPSDFNKLIPELMNSLTTEKQEGEKTEMFETRLLESARRILKF
ncbi:DNA repair exonuclease [archaeon]|jgi:DNA repair protein SbcD/Mre11|nr:DNA repair exonuclease [archaeon]MBT4373318.1 DNA repair exonuclease [archaeon]MBT4531663.1 DNA repair exonuclease [archaeon]MBT7001159.1 DNA repair exonuclease [archaeon]MBT7282355.1 DNA repair exonuclease [archaeon]